MKLKPHVETFWGDFLPPVAEGLGAIDQLVLCGDRPAEDAAGREAIRDWLRGGGRLWIMLDRVEPETVRLLLGEALCYQVVDRVGLTRIEMQHVVGRSTSPVDSPQDLDDPVEFLRIFESGGETVYAVNGWPAAFRFSFGRGQVLCTTLGPRGWMRTPDSLAARSAGDQPSGPGSLVQFVPSSPLRWLARDFLMEPEPSGDSAPSAALLLSEQIGYRIPGAGTVAGALGTFCLLLLGTGVALARRRRLEQLAWIGPAGAAVAAAILVACGISARNSVPPTLAQFQRAEVDPGGDEVDVRGVMALYRPEPSDVLPEAKRGGLVWPERIGREGEIHRIVWTDRQAWHWEHVNLPAGVCFAPFRETVQFDTPTVARGRFGPTGFSGTLHGPFQGCTDSLLVCPSGRRLLVRLGEDGDFSTGPGDELTHGQYVGASLLTDDQRRRQTIYEEVLSIDLSRPPLPRLFFWAEPLDLGFKLKMAAREAGSALVSMPIRVDPTPPGTLAVIPAPFLEYEAERASQLSHVPAYSNDLRQWVSLRQPSETWLLFRVPTQVLPLHVEHATAIVEIHAPLRLVEILGTSTRGTVRLGSRQGPQGKLRFEIDQPGSLEPDDEGSVRLGVRVGDDRADSGDRKRLATEPGTPWKVESVAMEITGRVEPPTANVRPR